MYLKRQILFIFFLLIYTCAFSQDYQQYQHYGKGISDSTTYKTNNQIISLLGKNSIRVGVYFTRATIAYDRALSNRFSVGAEGLWHWPGSTFTGYEGSLLSRFYFRDFNLTGFFIEEKITYGFFNPIVYDTIYYTNSYGTRTLNYLGAHPADLNYFGNTVSGGFRVYMGNFIFFEFLSGIRTGILTTGKNDLYMDRNISGVYNNAPSPANRFFSDIGPGFPFYVNVRLGVKF